MSIVFKVLWIEDDADYIDSLDIDLVSRHINEQGFKVSIEYRTSEEDINMEVDGLLYDLIVVDFNITDEGKNGAEVIRSVRDKNCLTEVIFYSGHSYGYLRQAALDHELEGVFFSTRESESLLYKICKVFDLNIRRLVDIDNIRGLVMSGVADLDKKLSDVIVDINSGFIDEHKMKLRKKIVDKMMPDYRDVKVLYSSEHDDYKHQFSQSLNNFKNLEPRDLDELLCNRSFSSFRRLDTVRSLCQSHADYEEKKEVLDEIFYLLHWRNALAHQNPIIKNNEKVFNVENKEVAFDSITSKRILRQLMDLDERINFFSVNTQVK